MRDVFRANEPDTHNWDTRLAKADSPSGKTEYCLYEKGQ